MSEKLDHISGVNFRAPTNESVVTPSDKKDVFLLGGDDLEMRRIRGRLKKHGSIMLDKVVTWEGADVATYESDIDQINSRGDTPVAIELRGAGEVAGVHEIDHHNDKSDRPASITQVLERLGVAPNLIDDLVAANDSGYIPAMEKLLDERYKDRHVAKHGEDRYSRTKQRIIDAVRLKDREAQGVTAEMEHEAELAVEAALRAAEQDPNGLVVVSLKGDRPSPVTDRLYSYWKEKDGRQNVVVVCNADKDEKEVWFFGAGDVSKETREYFLAKKEQQILDGTRVGNEFHAWGGGIGYGHKEMDAFSAAVVRDPEEVIGYIRAAETAKSQAR